MTLIDPTFAYLLLIFGLYGLLFEILHPGLFLPGFFGIVALLLASYSFNSLPIDYTGLALVFAGLGLIILETLIAGFGIAGLAGTILFISGSLILIDSETLAVSWLAIGLMAILNVVVFGCVLQMVLKSRKRPLKNGLTLLIGREGKTTEAIDLEGQALIQGELWSVFAKTPISIDKKIRVVAVHSTHLEIEQIT